MHYLISLGLLNNSLLAAMSLRTPLFFSLAPAGYFTECHVCFRNAGLYRHPHAGKTHLPFIFVPRHLRAFSVLFPKEHPPKRWESHLGLYSAHTGDTDQKQIPFLLGQAHHKTFSSSTAFLADVVEKAEAEIEWLIQLQVTAPTNTNGECGRRLQCATTCFLSHSEESKVSSHASLTYHWAQLWFPG